MIRVGNIIVAKGVPIELSENHSWMVTDILVIDNILYCKVTRLSDGQKMLFREKFIKQEYVIDTQSIRDNVLAKLGI